MKNFINKIINTLEIISDKIYFYFKPVTVKDLMDSFDEEVQKRITTDREIFIDAMEREYIFPRGSKEWIESYKKTVLQLLNTKD